MLVCPVTSVPAFPHRKPLRYVGPMPVFGKIQVDDTMVDPKEGESIFHAKDATPSRKPFAKGHAPEVEKNVSCQLHAS